jgi:hypothetical protein
VRDCRKRSKSLHTKKHSRFCAEPPGLVKSVYSFETDQIKVQDYF